jgi:hypothetical protein
MALPAYSRSSSTLDRRTPAPASYSIATTIQALLAAFDASEPPPISSRLFAKASERPSIAISTTTGATVLECLSSRDDEGEPPQGSSHLLANAFQRRAIPTSAATGATALQCLSTRDDEGEPPQGSSDRVAPSSENCSSGIASSISTWSQALSSPDKED